MNSIGIMQGRLSPRPQERLQAFPWQSWEEEFNRARECGFDSIEWLFEADDCERNPLWSEAGVARIRQLVAETDVKVRSVCADYFMIHPFFRVTDNQRCKSVDVLLELVQKATLIGVETILLPVLEISEVRTETEKALLLECLRQPLELAAANGIRLSLETELPAPEYRELVERANHPALGVYFDVGNATAAGYDAAAEVRELARLLCGVHIKDRKRQGVSVLLGQGDTDFAALFTALAEINYQGPLILQTAFGDNFLTTAKTHLAFVEELIRHAKNKDVRRTSVCR